MLGARKPRGPSVRRPAAGDVEDGAGRERAFAGAQPGDERGDLFHRDEAAARDLGQHVLGEFRAYLVEDARARRRRGSRIRDGAECDLRASPRSLTRIRLDRIGNEERFPLRQPNLLAGKYEPRAVREPSFAVVWAQADSGDPGQRRVMRVALDTEGEVPLLRASAGGNVECNGLWRGREAQERILRGGGVGICPEDGQR